MSSFFKKLNSIVSFEGVDDKVHDYSVHLQRDLYFITVASRYRPSKNIHRPWLNPSLSRHNDFSIQKLNEWINKVHRELIQEAS